MDNNRTKVNVAVVGATGTVGQRFIQQLENHPYFKVHALGASANSAGKLYGEVVHWLLPTPIPAAVASMRVLDCANITQQGFAECKIVFSALDSSVATEIESKFREAGKAVLSNSKNHRYDSDVPILVCSVNAPHAEVITHQPSYKVNGGFIITNPNCSTTGIVVALQPIAQAFGLHEVVAFTMQSVSGAGYPGVPSLDILGNVVPYIGEEEEKIEIETKKILGTLNVNDSSKYFHNNPLMISAHTNRVPVSEGHTICLSIKLKQAATVQQVKDALRNYRPKELETLQLPSVKGNPIVVLEENNRPQPKLDVERGNGYTVTVGRVRSGCGEASECSFDLRLTLLVHNTVLGAAGSSIQNAEYCHAKGYIN
ncbi:hypothetical protein SAMD00019534_048150 [Acytostelium subglobosum LB1]|uniref:hypothetical protein n=1 Tax=Acytostelium subglobosum LB1 TaxID=1410327 RepID=UPI000644AE47|nr:hypothetical protein SAMD00019534_048150 [Acytostelium subglobosum LB1]GAM21640.1 hypothetical protein SAMD00019534_048150 [Acytostelium subglobosum LB1]|eukprot:XP_012755759.1 hypothetical protein SAMD00019534_048150 [Acytostelium subglobosum LB1]